MGAVSSWEKERLGRKDLETAQRAVFWYMCICGPRSSVVTGLFVIGRLVGRLLRLEMEIQTIPARITGPEPCQPPAGSSGLNNSAGPLEARHLELLPKARLCN